MSSEQAKTGLAKNHAILFTVGGLVLVAVIVFTVILLTQPTRSVEAFCGTYKEENARLSSSSGDTYSAKPFTHSSSNPQDFIMAFSKLERVAPEEIQPDVKTMKQIFETIDKDPSQTVSAAMSAMGAESNVTNWKDQHCQE